MSKSIYAGTLALALVMGVASVSAGSWGGEPGTPAKVVQPSAGQRVAKLDVVNVSCVTCGPVVKRALSSMPGVADVSVREGIGASAIVRVVYDPRRIAPAALAAATTDAGFPAKVVNK